MELVNLLLLSERYATLLPLVFPEVKFQYLKKKKKGASSSLFFVFHDLRVAFCTIPINKEPKPHTIHPL
jgi:hypothetical protein